MSDEKGIIVWQCSNCKAIMISKNWERHTMDDCPCGKTSCDMEMSYTRWNGFPHRAKYHDIELLLKEEESKKK